MGLGMNLDKAKVTLNSFVDPRLVIVDNASIEAVQGYIFVGQTIQLGKNNFYKEADRRIRLGWEAYGKLY